MSKLTPKQKAFCDYYIETGNATEAYKRAGYSVKSDNAAGVEGHKLLKNPKIKAHVSERMEQKDKERIASQDEVLERLTRVLRREEKEYNVVTLKVRKTFTDDNGRRHTVDEEKAEIVPVPAKVSDVNKAAELLGKRYALWTDKKEINGKLDFADLLTQAWGESDGTD